MSVELKTEVLPEGSDPFLTLNFGEGEEPDASLTLTATFEGDWRALFNNVDPDENTARGAVARELFSIVMNEFTAAGAQIEAGSEGTPA